MVTGNTRTERTPTQPSSSSQRRLRADEDVTSSRKRPRTSNGRKPAAHASDDEGHSAPSSDAYVPDEIITSIASSSQKDSKKSVKGRGPITYGPSARFGLLPNAQFVTHDRMTRAGTTNDADDARIVRRLYEDETRYDVLSTRNSKEPYQFNSPQSSIASFLDKDRIVEDEGEDEEPRREPSIAFREALPSFNDGISFTYEVGGQISQHENKVGLHQSISLRDASGSDVRKGCIINAGSYVYSADWVPRGYSGDGEIFGEYLAVAAALRPWQRSKVTERIPTGSAPATVQIWSVDAIEGHSALAMVLCFDGGRISSVRWSPVFLPPKDSISGLGVIAVAMQDGGVEIYKVPDPKEVSSEHDDAIYIKLMPLLRLDTNRGVPMALDWHKSAKLAVAFSDGYVGVWDVGNSLAQLGPAFVRPLVYARVSRSPLSDITWDAHGTHIYSSALDGSVYATSFEQPDFSTTLAHSRDVAYPIAYDRTLGLPIFERLEDASIRVVDFHDKLASRAIYPHYGRIRALCTSPHHPFIASGSADGSVKTANVPILMENHRRWAGSGMTTIFRLDMTDRQTASLRFVDGFMTMPLTREPPDDVRAKYGSGKDVVTGPARFGLTMGWHPAVSVTNVRWNTNVGRETWLASGLAVGLLRIDVVGS